MRTTAKEALIDIDTPVASPSWAVLERQLLDAQVRACAEFFARYFDERGYLLCVPAGAATTARTTRSRTPELDDAARPRRRRRVLDALQAGWEGHLRQYTEARTTSPARPATACTTRSSTPVRLAPPRRGATPSSSRACPSRDDLALPQRTRRFAGFYMNEDPQAPNYDPSTEIIRSLFNGRAGRCCGRRPALDWAGDPIEVEGRFTLRHGETLLRGDAGALPDYTDVVGDNPMNLGATTLAFNAYALTGEAKYRDWLLEYVDAWVERTEANGGLHPDERRAGRHDRRRGCGWYGGVYGWGFTVYDPAAGRLAHRPSFLERAIRLRQRAAPHGRAALRRPLAPDARLVNANSKKEQGQVVLPAHVRAA